MCTQHYPLKSTLLRSSQATILHLKVPPISVYMSCALTYFRTGRKKLKQVEAEINRLSNISHPNLLRVLAVKLILPHGNGAGPARLVILSEERPSLSLEDVLEDCECLKESKATVRFIIFVFQGL